MALTVQSGSQQQLPSQLPSVRSHVHEPTDVTVTGVAVGVSGTAVQSAMGYVGNALVPAASAGLVCAMSEGALFITNAACEAYGGSVESFDDKGMALLRRVKVSPVFAAVERRRRAPKAIETQQSR